MSLEGDREYLSQFVSNRKFQKAFVRRQMLFLFFQHRAKAFLADTQKEEFRG